MADFHLAIGVKDKPMDIFGVRWSGYMDKIGKNCMDILGEDDVLLIPGDISWGTYTSQAEEDLRFIEELPGRKVISKGNHDYWWTSAKKLNELKERLELKSITFLHNDFFVYENVAVCANRGWNYSMSEENLKIYKRELIRMELSLSAAEKAGFKEKIAVTHYPPIIEKKPDKEYMSLFEKYGVKTCLYGHLHNISAGDVFEGVCGSTEFKLVSSDYLNFMPLRIM